MAKKSIIQREIKKEKIFNKFKTIRENIKKEIINSKTFEERIYNFALLQKLPRNSSKTRLLRIIK